MLRALAPLLAILATVLPLLASEIRMTLLDDERVLNETANLLQQNGCSSESVAAFKKLVRFQKTDLIDRTPFPKLQDGYYSFKSVGSLGKAMPDPFYLGLTNRDALHYSLMCVDVAILLLKDTGAKAPKVRENFANKHFVTHSPMPTDHYPHDENPDRPLFYVQSITDYNFPGYRAGLISPTNIYAGLTGLNRTSHELDLAICLSADRQLTRKCENTDEAIKGLFDEWIQLQESDGLKYPEKLMIVSAGYVPTQYHYWMIDHMGVCFWAKGTLVYVAKSGSAGPYLRIDFNTEGELAEFVAGSELQYSSMRNKIIYHSPAWVGINNRLVRIARPKTSANSSASPSP